MNLVEVSPPQRFMKIKRRQQQLLLLGIGLLGIITLILVMQNRTALRSRAATNMLEAESATLAGTVTRQSDLQAAGGGYLQFGSSTAASSTPPPPTPTPGSTTVTIAAAGDIACPPGGGGYLCKQMETSDIIIANNPTAVLALGDLQYDSATLSNLQQVYDTSWGRFKSKTYPVLGNHEGEGTGYFDYFYGVGVNGTKFGTRDKGWYSFDVGSWHIVGLNSNCDKVQCGVGSEQERWLRADLTAHPRQCTLAFWHHPRYSSGHDGSPTTMSSMWQALMDHQVEVVLVGHSHDYERFAPQNASGQAVSNGIREFVVGTGGRDFTGWRPAEPNSQIKQNTSFGVLLMTLNPTSYSWKFQSIAGSTFTDSGSQTCH